MGLLDGVWRLTSVAKFFTAHRLDFRFDRLLFVEFSFLQTPDVILADFAHGHLASLSSELQHERQEILDLLDCVVLKFAVADN